MKKYITFLLCAIAQLPCLLGQYFIIGVIGLGVIAGLTISSIINDNK